jgi:hypothetical protein
VKTTSESATTISELKVEANRKKSPAVHGPTSVDGKSIVSRNAVRHSLLSSAPVLERLHRRDDRLALVAFDLALEVLHSHRLDDTVVVAIIEEGRDVWVRGRPASRPESSDGRRR